MTMKERVVYVLGAGFSAPLGLPVMGNFIEKSKDLYFGDTKTYPGFAEIFEEINRMSRTKNFFVADLSNIEEILSILDVGSFARGEELADKFARYICDVIKAFTPSPSVKWSADEFGGSGLSDYVVGDLNAHYAKFVALICNVSIGFLRDGKGWVPQPKRVETAPAFYDIVTLNYDTVIEQFADVDGLSEALDSPYRFNLKNQKADSHSPRLAKLHGSVKNGKIVPPTWRKGSNHDVSSEWATAMEVLSHANHIRFIGYSLPAGDAYVRYLLKAAMLDVKHLKTIDVLCLDPTGEVEERFGKFIQFGNYRFRSQNTLGYLELLRNENSLENAHSYFFAANWGPPARA